jgi:hypothetical protein
MTIPAIFTWPIADEDGVALLQDVDQNANMVLNGALSTIVQGVAEVNYAGISRTLSLTSAGDNSGVTFVISGALDGYELTENLVGPNADTVYSVNFYSIIYSITATVAPAVQVSAGSGTTGKTNWYLSNYQQEVSNMSIQVEATANITYSFSTTLDDIQEFTYANIVSFSPVATLTAATTSILASYSAPVRYSTIKVTASNDTGKLTATFLQQGIK